MKTGNEKPDRNGWRTIELSGAARGAVSGAARVRGELAPKKPSSAPIAVMNASTMLKAARTQDRRVMPPPRRHGRRFCCADARMRRLERQNRDVMNRAKTACPLSTRGLRPSPPIRSEADRRGVLARDGGRSLRVRLTAAGGLPV